MKTLSIEGNIGVGKTTMIELLQKEFHNRANISVFAEPVHTWTPLLKLCYSEPSRMSGKEAVKQMRTLLAQKKKQLPKINSPLAKYSNSGELSCVICEVNVKNESLWSFHLSSPKHKLHTSNLKRKVTETAENTVHRDERPPPPKIIKSILKKRSNPGTVKPDISKRPKVETNHCEDNTETSVDKNNCLPSGFFDSEHEDEEENDNTKTSANSDLPEGFYDDPVADAKVHKKPYVDPLEKEWEIFQKEMQHEASKSEMIVDDEDAIVTVEKELDEVGEQINCFSKANKLYSLKEKLDVNVATSDSVSSMETQDDIDDFDDFDSLVGWRSKNYLN